MNAIRVPPPDPREVREGRNLKTVPWGHQQLAIDYMRGLLHKPHPSPLRRGILDGGAAMLAMGMGTGKTLVAESMIANLPIDDFPDVVVLMPLRVVSVWPEQIERHVLRRDIRVLALDDRAGSVANKRALAEKQQAIARIRGERFVLLMNYESAWREPMNKWLLKQTWGLAILDESHRIKQASGKASMFCARLRERAVYRICLTGTPMPHSPLDIYAQFRFLDWTIFGNTYSGFKQKYAIYGGFNNKQIIGFNNLGDLETKMRRITFRVGKEVLDLPEETVVTYRCDLGPTAQKVYDSLEKEFVAEVRQGTVTAANAMVKLLRLQQITGGFVKTDDGQVVPAAADNAKADLLADTLEDIDPAEAVVVFCRFHADLNAVHEVGKKLGRGTRELSGRKDEMAEWKAGHAPILAVQIDAGGEGVNLTRARYAIYYSLGYSLGKYDQSRSRVHRPGQHRPVTTIHLLVRDSVDERVMRALEKRAEIVQSILDELHQEKRK